MRWLSIVAVCAACGSDGRPAELELPSDPPATTIASESTAKETAPVTLDGLVEDGRHWRLATAHGPVHVWIPRGYRARRAETVVYVHGFYTHVDEAWQQQFLAAQFAASAINAMFVACEAPASGSEPVAWESLPALLAAVEHGTGEPRPRRRVVAVGHSGAWRTMQRWLADPSLDTVVLLDAVYGDIELYRDWVLASPKHRLIDIGDDTRKWTEQLHALLPDSVILDGFPPTDQEIPREVARARILYIRSSFGHFPLVTGGIAIPIILRTLTRRRLLDVPLDELLETR
jgi:hypothetical protein